MVTAALSDTILISGAVLGVSVVLLTVPMLKVIITILGILFLIKMGWHSWRAPVLSQTSENETRRYWTLPRRVGHTLRASLLNPHAIMDTVIVIGGGSVMYSRPDDKLAYAIAAMLVSWMWFVALSLAGRLLVELPHSFRLLKGFNDLAPEVPRL